MWATRRCSGGASSVTGPGRSPDPPGAVSQVVIGHGEALDQLLVGLLGRGHALVEDVPGVGKTMLAGRGDGAGLRVP